MILQESTTIAAIATPPGYGGIGIIRLSGPDALFYTRRLLKDAENLPFEPNYCRLFSLFDPDKQSFLDQAVITYFAAPKSFTGEDVVEISLHGSPVVLSEVLRLLFSFGVKPAEPGEFTYRAFLNGRIDLTQAEAINDLIHSTTLGQAQVAARQLQGQLSKEVRPLKEALVRLIVLFESSVEFVEDNLNSLDIQSISDELCNLTHSIEQLISSYQFGRFLRVGIKLAIVGRPNVGKSSLFNKLLGCDRAIVTNIPGTTRDTLNERFSLNGIPIELIDTAGIRETSDIIERIGVERTRTAISEADFIIAVIEPNHELLELESAFLSHAPFNFLVINKCDLGCTILDKDLDNLSQGRPYLLVSALSGEGIDDLRQHLSNTLTNGVRSEYDGGIITQERHYLALKEALVALHTALADLKHGYTEEIILVHLHQALSSLGLITGETLIVDILNQIFSTFCIGK